MNKILTMLFAIFGSIAADASIIGQYSSMAIRSDHKIVVAFARLDRDSIILERLSPDGKIDESFGTAGKVVVQHPSIQNVDIRGLAVTDAAIYLLPSSNVLFRVAQSGTTVTEFPKDFLSEAMQILRDGSVLVTGRNIDGAEIRRVLNDGSLDTAFGSGRFVRPFQLCIRGLEANPYTLALSQVPGKFLVGGTVSLPGFGILSTADYHLTQFNEDGTLDASFGKEGEAHFVFEDKGQPVSSSIAGVFSIQSRSDQQRIYAFGTALWSNDRSGVSAARFLADGQPDPTYGKKGGALAAFVPMAGTHWPVGAFVDAHERFTILATTDKADEPGKYHFVRFDQDGQLDQSFGFNGFQTVDSGFPFIFPDNLRQGDQEGHFYITGRLKTGDFIISRHLPDGSLDPSFGDAGKVVLPLLQ